MKPEEREVTSEMYGAPNEQLIRIRVADYFQAEDGGVDYMPVAITLKRSELAEIAKKWFRIESKFE